MPMDRPKLTATDLHRRYCKGERHFANTDLSGASLRGLNLRGIDLSGADLSHTDLRGTNLTEAKLIDAGLCGAKTGVLRRWVVIKVIVALAVSPLALVLMSFPWLIMTQTLVSPGSSTYTGTANGDQILAIVGLTVTLGLLFLGYSRGISATFSISLIFVGFSIIYLIPHIIQAAIGPKFLNLSSAAILVFTILVSLTAVFNILGTSVSIISNTVVITCNSRLFISLINIIIPFSITLYALFAFFTSSGLFTSKVSVDIVGTVIGMIGIILNHIFSCLISRRTLEDASRDRIIRSICIWIIGLGGTTLRMADLTDANCSRMILKSAHLHNAKLIRTRFHLAQKVHLARLGKTLLSDFAVQALLITLRGRGKAYLGKNLKGANLAGADLVGADFTEADLSQSTLEGAELQHANLTKTQILGTEFRQANLTGACLEAWNIDSTTKLDGALCDYVYLLKTPQERRPNDPNRNFAPGEFTKLFQKAQKTVDLIFADGIDWKAFFQSFQELQTQYADQELSIQSIEKKTGGAFVIRLEVSAEVDKSAIEAAAMEKYQAQLRLLESRYQERLQLQGDQLEFYRQQTEIERNRNTRLDRIIEIMAENTGDTYNIGELKTAGFAPRGIASNNTFNDFSNTQDLTQAAAQIQSLLSQLQQQGQSPEAAQQQVADDLAEQAKQDPTLLGKLMKWGQKLGDATVTDVVKGVVKLALRSAGVPLP